MLRGLSDKVRGIHAVMFRVIDCTQTEAPLGAPKRGFFYRPG
jgi:hypothetical protein